MNQIVVHKDRTTVVTVSLGMDVSEDTITSEIREGRSSETALIAEWSVAFDTDGVDGELILTIDDSVASDITQRKGYMDMKRVSGGEALSVFDHPLEVVFADSITE